jgi:hypothetical protein
VLYFRQTTDACRKWIRDRHQPKPHDAAHATTIVREKGHIPLVQAWLDPEMAKKAEDRKLHFDARANISAKNTAYSLKAADYIGIIGDTNSHSIEHELV